MFELIEKYVNFKTGSFSLLETIKNTEVSEIFQEDSLALISCLSEMLMKDEAVRKYPDVFQFAFWCRNSGLEIMKSKYSDIHLKKGRGIVLHFAPSNIPVHFAYLLVISLLSGNTSFIRISGKNFIQTDIIISHLNQLLTSRFQHFTKRIFIIQYDHQKEITDYFSGISNARTIWGGNETISTIQKSQLKPGSIDISFGEKHSFCLINAAQYLQSQEKEILANDFYNDTYIYDQYSCSSPTLIVWIGSQPEIHNAQEIFWDELEKIVNKKYIILAGQVVSKFEYFCEISSKLPVKLNVFGDSKIMRATLQDIVPEVNKIRCRHGLFLEYGCSDLSETAPLFDENLQTITYTGFDSLELLKRFKSFGSSGCERIVKTGRALEFSVIWDGIDLIGALSKTTTI